MPISLPRVALLTDCVLSDIPYGIARTLETLFAAYPSNDLLVCSPKASLEGARLSPLYRENTIGWVSQRLGRLGKKRGAQPFERAAHTFLAPSIAPVLERFRPELLCVATSDLNCLIVANQLRKALQCPFVMYIMDDLRTYESVSWPGGSGAQILRDTWGAAQGIIAVSEKLVSVACERYGAKPNRTLVVHNPVDTKQFIQQPFPPAQPIRLVYAGSIWPMHADALCAVARGVEVARMRGLSIALTLYTLENFWKESKEVWESTGTLWGGSLEHEKLPQALSAAHACVCASAFHEDFRHLAMGSVQTKLTEYMACGRPIIACGPEESACTEFVKRWQCGLTLSTSDPETIAERLISFFADTEQIGEMGRQGRIAAEINFEVGLVQSQLYTYLKETAACG